MRISKILGKIGKSELKKSIEETTLTGLSAEKNQKQVLLLKKEYCLCPAFR